MTSEAAKKQVKRHCVQNISVQFFSTHLPSLHMLKDDDDRLQVIRSGKCILSPEGEKDRQETLLIEFIQLGRCAATIQQ